MSGKYWSALRRAAFSDECPRCRAKIADEALRKLGSEGGPSAKEVLQAALDAAREKAYAADRIRRVSVSVGDFVVEGNEVSFPRPKRLSHFSDIVSPSIQNAGMAAKLGVTDDG